jgi:hypothetical protein
MKKFLVVFVCLLFAASLLVGCGQKEAQEDTSAAGQPEEMADTTRMDSAAMQPDTTMMQDTTMMEGGEEMETEGH